MTGTTTIYSLNYPQGTDLVTNGAAAIQTLAEQIGTNVPPTGSLLAYAGSTSPSGWLLCAGQAVSRTTYATLFGIIGTSYGVGDGSTTFNVPDLRGRIPAGKDDMGGSAASRLTSTTITGGATTLGNAGGAQTHTLTGAESGTTAHTHTQAQHRHTFNYTSTTGGILSGTVLGQSVAGGAVVDYTTATNNNSTAANASNAHNNVQPTIILNYIIKT